MIAKREILPGATIGVLGSGQLGRMFAIAARRMGYRVHTFSPERDTPTGQVADREITASYTDLDAVRDFARSVQVVTFEFENIPAATAATAAEYTLVRPDGSVLHSTQHRVREKTFLSRAGIPVTPFRHIRSLPELFSGLCEIGYPAILKTAGFGYDGKGQAPITAAEQVETAWQALGEQEAVLEAFVEFSSELSIVAARGLDGSFSHYGPMANTHSNGILDISLAPVTLPPGLTEQALQITRSIVEELELVGVLCVEFFLTRNGKLLVNELAPRPHNSGHLTCDACVTSQFEQQLRAICGLHLGSPELLRPAAMANLLGDLWQSGEPNWISACSFPEVKLHLYGKLISQPGRKMGHLTALARDADEAARLVRTARSALLS